MNSLHKKDLPRSQCNRIISSLERFEIPTCIDTHHHVREGKETQQVNAKLPERPLFLGTLCFIEKGEKNDVCN
jgi:hypothetical protein